MTPGEAARLLGVSADTVRNWSDAGELATLRTVGGNRLFRKSEVLRLLVRRSQRKR